MNLTVQSHWQNEDSNAVGERVQQAFILNFTCIFFRMSDKSEGYETLTSSVQTEQKTEKQKETQI